MGNISEILLWTFMIIQMLLVLFLVKLIIEFLSRFRLYEDSELPLLRTGDKAPLFREKDIEGNNVKLDYYSFEDTLLIFVQNSCDKCKSIINLLGELQQPSSLRIILASRAEEGSAEYSVPNGISLLQSNVIIDNYFIDKFPTAVHIDDKGTIISISEINNKEQFKHLINQTSYNADKEGTG